METFLVILALVAVVFLPSAVLAWLLMLGLGGLGVSVGFFPLWVLTFVAGCIFGSASRS